MACKKRTVVAVEFRAGVCIWREPLAIGGERLGALGGFRCASVHGNAISGGVWAPAL